MAIAARVQRALPEPLHEARELAHRLLIGFAALLGAAELRRADHAALRVAAGPRDERRRSRRKEIDPVEGALLLIETRPLARDPLLPDVVAGQVKVDGGLELAGVAAAARKLALPP